MDANDLNFWMLSQAQDWAANTPTLAANIGPSSTQVNLVSALPWGTPLFVSIDSEVMSVDPANSTSTLLKVSRGAQSTTEAPHTVGTPVLTSVGILQASVAVADTQVTIAAAPPSATPPIAPVPGIAGVLQIDSEIMQVTKLDSTGMVATVTRAAFGTTAAPHNAGGPAFAPIAPNALYYCTKTNRLQLLSTRIGTAPAEMFSDAAALVEIAPMARDSFGNYARWDAPSGLIMAGGSGPDEVPIFAAPSGQSVTDLAMGYDGILYIALNGTLILVDRRGRWPNFTLNAPGFNFWRLAALPQSGVLALDRTPAAPQLGTVTGAPLQVGPVDTPEPGIMSSCQPNLDPPQLAATYPLPASEVFVGLTPMQTDQQPNQPTGQQTSPQFALLSWGAASGANQASYLRLFSFNAGLGLAWKLDTVLWPYAVAWIGDSSLAVLASESNEALIFDLSEAGRILIPAGDSYILKAANQGPFAHTLNLPPYYSSGAAGLPLRPLLPLSLNSLAQSGSTDSSYPKLIDSGASQTVWHRLYLEAILPPRCGVTVWLTASDQPSSIAAAGSQWYPHVFGDVDMTPLPAETPSGVWLPFTSEVPFAAPRLSGTPIANQQGLFMVLVQRANTAVRNLRGRFLGIRVEMNGDCRSTPEIAALRVWAPRFSYIDNYLPELYREGKFSPAADQAGPSTRHDFFARFTNIFEAQMTDLEDRIANSYLLTRPEAAPDSALDWLGGWVGLNPTGYPPGRRRARLLAASNLHRQRGTVGGVTLALDVATNGMCTRGAVIVIEDFRLRHIFATILGADLSIQNNPLLPGYSGSSNSFVGDTLFLGDPKNQAEVLALFSANLPETTSEQQEIEQFYDALANRMTVFIHNQVEKVDINLITKIVEYEKPAHVAATIQIATQPFMIGLASLLGVNSYVAPEPPRDPIVLNQSRIGRYNMVIQSPSLDPRMET
jgi:phage tail-like protein